MLELQINGIRVKGPPSRSLELDCSVQNKNAKEVALVKEWITVATGGNRSLVEGFYFEQFHAPSGRATIKAGDQCPGEILIPMSASVLNSIEEERQGKDLELRIYSRILIASVEEIVLAGGRSCFLLGAPQETQFSVNGSTPIIYKISQSDWVKLLSQLKWSELELFEVPMEAFSSDPNLKRAIELLRKAQDRFSYGDWGGTLQNCRQAFEAAAAEIGQTENKKDNFNKLLSRVGSGIKSERLNEIIKALSEFCHLGRHEDFPAIDITREDARSMLRCTLAIFSLLGGKIN